MEKNKKRMAILCFCILFVLLGVLSWRMMFSSYDGEVTAKVYQDGTLLYTFDLGKIKEEKEFVIGNGDGEENTVVVSKEGICVSEASCPDQICVKRGVVSYSDVPIVCMPNKLVIEFEKTGEEGTDGDISY